MIEKRRLNVFHLTSFATYRTMRAELLKDTAWHIAYVRDGEAAPFEAFYPVTFVHRAEGLVVLP